MPERSPALRRRIMLLVAVAVAAAAFIVDAKLTEGDVAPAPPPCEIVTDPVCNDDRNAEFQDRLEGAYELEDGLTARYWVYAAALTLGVLGIAAIGPRGEDEGWGDILDDVGVTGVAWLAGGVVVLAVAGGGLIDPPAQPVLGPAVAFIVVGVVGRLSHLRRTQPARDAGPLGPVVPMTGLGLVAAAALLAMLVLISQNAQAECGTADAAWVGMARSGSALAGVVAALLGLIALAGRRWIAALVCITVGPTAVIVALGAGACFS